MTDNYIEFYGQKDRQVQRHRQKAE